MKKIIRLATAGLILFNLSFIPAAVNASERLKVCAEYKNSGKKYFVDATYLTGKELNQATKSRKYTYYSNYVVIFWDQGQASIIELDSLSSLAGISYFGSDGHDQQGYPWEVTKVSHSIYCW